MITLHKGSIFNSDADILVNAVNPIGSMGGGIARAFVLRYPEMEREYIEFCKNGGYENAFTQFYKVKGSHTVCNLLTVDRCIQAYYGYIEKGLNELVQYMRATNSKGAALPLLGCGIGGLDVEDVLGIYLNILPSDLDFEVWFYEGE